jgi:hypothetical protein
MKPVGDEFLRAAVVSGVTVGRRSQAQASLLHQQMRSFFGEEHTYWLWEGLKNCISFRDPLGWRLIPEFLKNHPALVFFNEFDDQRVFEISTGDDLLAILSESYGYEFYVTNDKADFLVCFNHHDFVIACGSAVTFFTRFSQSD